MRWTSFIAGAATGALGLATVVMGWCAYMDRLDKADRP